ncbi:hypothetical protein NCS52_01166700 [Fusarium sp. LHS14.1]|nr:hypothetical protein NCS52_01166700 [Fusarium sp. LHS14.1]
MPPNVSSPPTVHSLNPEAADEVEVQQSTTEDLQPDNGTETEGPGARALQLAALKESDPTHILFRRFTELASLSLDLEGNHLEQLGHDLRQMILTGEDDVNDFNDKFLGKLRRYYQVGFSLRKVLGFDGPSQPFLDHTLFSAKQSWAPGQGLHLNASDHDFASLFDMDKFDQILTHWPHKPWARRFLNKLNLRTERGDEFEALWIPGEYVKFISVGVFNTCVGIFVVAPMAIQTLKVTSPAGEVVTYLVFVLVAGFAIQMLVPGFTRQLLVYLAYAGVMAAVMRQ